MTTNTESVVSQQTLRNSKRDVKHQKASGKKDSKQIIENKMVITMTNSSVKEECEDVFPPFREEPVRVIKKANTVKRSKPSWSPTSS